MKLIYNAKIILEDKILENHYLIFDNIIKKICSMGNKELNIIIKEENISECFNLKGNYISAGFIETHMHGCSGFDTMECYENNALNTIRKNITKSGVTSFLPTTMTMDLEKIHKVLYKMKENIKTSPLGAKIIGCHLEGPFISKKFHGAQDEKFILQNCDLKLFESFKDIIKIITFAPELENSENFIYDCLSNSIIPSIGHSNASFNESIKAIQCGVNHVTHTFNVMTKFHHREPGIIGAASICDNVYCELICDNLHIHPAVSKMLLRLKGIEKIIIVTDAMQACLLDDGAYYFGGNKVNVNMGTAKLENGNLAAGVLPINKAVKNFIHNTDVSLVDAIKTVTVNPANLLNLYDKLGSLTVGKLADFTVFDKELNIISVFVEGKELKVSYI